MPDEQTQIIGTFSLDLHEAYQRSGVATYRELERRLNAAVREAGLGSVTLGRTSAWATLTGKRKGLPPWDQVSLLIRVFRAAAVERNIDPARVGSLAEWKVKHEEATAAFRAAATAPSPRIPVMTVPSPGVPAVPAGGGPVWWSAYSDIVPASLERYLNHEPLSDRIISYEHRRVPALLQTPEYAAEAVGREYPSEPEDRLARRVRLRMHRQRHLNREAGRPLMWAILNEGALRSDLVSATTMRAQVRHLLRLGRNVRIQIIPASHPAHDSADGPLTILRFDCFQLQDLVYLEHGDSALYPSGEEDLAHYQHAVHKLGLAGLKPRPSRDLLRRIESEI